MSVFTNRLFRVKTNDITSIVLRTMERTHRLLRQVNFIQKIRKLIPFNSISFDSVDELLTAVDSINETESKICSRGTKLKFPLGTAEEAATIQSYQGNHYPIYLRLTDFLRSDIPDDLRHLISMERIAKRSARSIAHIENGLVKIVRRMGKWKHFGLTNYLKWHEALYLMEVVSFLYLDRTIIVC